MGGMKEHEGAQERQAEGAAAPGAGPWMRMFRLDAAEAQRIEAQPDAPHRHDYEELIIGMKGRLEHFIDFETVELDAPLVSFVTKGKVHRAIPRPKDGACDMWVIRFPSEFIPETAFQFYAHFHNRATLALEEGGCFERLALLCQILSQELHRPTPEWAVVRHLLSALFTMIDAERRREAERDALPNPGSPPPNPGSQHPAWARFLQLLEANYARPVGVEFYAAELGMSTRNLNLICKQVMQQTATEIIETRKLLEAKNALAHSALTVSEIGWGLGYKEKAHFTHVFKRRTGVTPREFRQEMRALLRGDGGA